MAYSVLSDLPGFTAGTPGEGGGGGGPVTYPLYAPYGTAAAPSYAFAGISSDTGLFALGDRSLALATAGQARFFINSAGDVGVPGNTILSDLRVLAGASLEQAVTMDGTLGVGGVASFNALSFFAEGLNSLGRIGLFDVQLLSGSASPSGTVSAPTGSLYLSAAGGEGTTLYYKAVGTDVNGWVAVAPGGATGVTYPLLAPYGTAAAPSYAFAGTSADTGLFATGDHALALATSGSARLRIDALGAVSVPGPTTLANLSVTGASALQGGATVSGGSLTAQTGVFASSLTAQAALDVIGAASLSGPITLQNGASLLNGTLATPNAAVTATPGSVYLSATGGTGATLWIKETGVANTGWTSLSGNGAVFNDVTITSSASNNLTLTCNGSVTSFPTLTTVGTFSAASNVNQLFTWNMGNRNTANGATSLVYRLNLGATNATAPTLLSFDNVFGGYNIFTYNDTSRAFNLTGGLSVGGTSTTTPPAGGLQVAGASTFQGSVAFQGTVTGLPAATVSFPLAAPATTLNSYSFTGSTTTGMGSSAAGTLDLQAAGTTGLRLTTGGRALFPVQMGVGAAAPNVANVFTLVGSNATTGVNPGIPTMQISGTPGLGGTFSVTDAGTTLTSLYGLNAFTGDGVPISTFIQSLNNRPFLVSIGTVYTQIALSGYISGGAFFWNFGSKTQALSTVGVTGSLAVGSGVAAGTAAPANGFLVQGPAVFQGGASFSGTVTGISAPPPTAVISAGNFGSNGVPGVAAGLTQTMVTFTAPGTFYLPAATVPGQVCMGVAGAVTAFAVTRTSASDTIYYGGFVGTAVAGASSTKASGTTFTSPGQQGNYFRAVCVATNQWVLTDLEGAAWT